MLGAEAAPTAAPGANSTPLPSGLIAFFDAVGAVTLLTRDALRWAIRRPPEWRVVSEQLEQIGWKSLSIVNLTALFTGMVLALQLGSYLSRFGAPYETAVLAVVIFRVAYHFLPLLLSLFFFHGVMLQAAHGVATRSPQFDTPVPPPI